MVVGWWRRAENVNLDRPRGASVTNTAAEAVFVHLAIPEAASVTFTSPKLDEPAPPRPRFVLMVV